MALDQQLIYSVVMAVKTHFESSHYDAFRCGFKLRNSGFVKCGRGEAYAILKLQKLYRDKTQLIEHLVANFAKSSLVAERLWIGELASSGAVDAYKDWKSITDSMTYIFRRDLISMRDENSSLSFDELLACDRGFTYPVPAFRFVSGRMNLETLCALNMMTGFLDDANVKIAESIRWPLFYMRVKKYEPFLTSLKIVNKAKMAKITREVFS